MKTIVLSIIAVLVGIVLFLPTYSFSQANTLKAYYIEKKFIASYLSEETNPCSFQLIQYRYDALNRLTLYFVSFCDTINAIMYDYDGNGNRISETSLFFVRDNPSRYRLENPKPPEKDFEGIIKKMLSQLMERKIE